MKALVFDGDLRLDPAYPTPVPGPGESLVKVRMAGVCNTDVEILRGYMGFRGVPGHEFVGLVAQSSSAALAGARVVGEINCPCGACALCRRGLGKHCSERAVLGISGRDGAFAEYVVVPDANLHAVPPGVADEEAVFTEPLAAAFEILESVRVRPSDRVLVVGSGKLGKLIAQVLRDTRCALLVTARRGEDVDFLRGRGIEPVPPEALEGLPLFDVVVECTGAREGFAAARRMVRPRGTLVAKSTFAGLLEIDISRLVVDEIRLVGSRCGPFAPALRALASGAVAVRPLVSRLVPLEEAATALDAALHGERGKVLFRME